MSATATIRTDRAEAGTRADAAFASVLLAFVALAGAKTLYFSSVPADHEQDWLGAYVRAVARLVIMLSSFPASARGWERTSTFLRGVGLAVFMSVGTEACLRYVYWTGRGFPLADDALAGLDHLLGFDWPTYVGSFRGHPLLLHALAVAYATISRQSIAIGLFLAYRRMPERLYAFCLAQNLAVAMVGIVTVAMPAFGAYHHFGATPGNTPFIVAGDMDGMAGPLRALRAGFLDLGATVPLVQLPSFHAAACVILSWAAWPTRMRLPVLGINLLMFASAPIYGSHYLSDMLAGVVVAVVAVDCATRFVACASAAGRERRTASDCVSFCKSGSDSISVQLLISFEGFQEKSRCREDLLSALSQGGMSVDGLGRRAEGDGRTRRGDVLRSAAISRSGQGAAVPLFSRIAHDGARSSERGRDRNVGRRAHGSPHAHRALPHHDPNEGRDGSRGLACRRRHKPARILRRRHHEG